MVEAEWGATVDEVSLSKLRDLMLQWYTAEGRQAICVDIMVSQIFESIRDSGRIMI